MVNAYSKKVSWSQATTTTHRVALTFFFCEAQVNFSQYHQNAISDYQMHPKHIFLATGEKQMIWSLNFFFATSIYNPHKKNLHSAPKTKEKMRYLNAERTLIASREIDQMCFQYLRRTEKKFHCSYFLHFQTTV